jgi:hypothetical protein
MLTLDLIDSRSALLQACRSRAAGKGGKENAQGNWKLRDTGAVTPAQTPESISNGKLRPRTIRLYATGHPCFFPFCILQN